MTEPVSVVIPALNDAAGLPTAVQTILAQVNAQVAQLLLCVGPSVDKTLEVAQALAAEHSVVAVVANPSGGISAGLNAGLGVATAGVLVRVDARCRLPHDYIAMALETMTETGAQNVGAVQVPVGSTPMQGSIARALQHVAGSGAAAYRHGGERRDVETAFLGVYDVQALVAIGGWDEAFARNEDAELNHRLRSAGHRVVLDPRLQVEYEPRLNLPSLARQYFDYGWWRRRMIAKHHSMQLRQLAAPAVVLGLAGGTALAVVLSPWFLVIPAGYAVALMAIGLTLGDKPTVGDRVRVPLALATMHISWGTGFLASAVNGLWRTIKPG